MKSPTQVAGLRAALPYLQLYRGARFVIKIGGEALTSQATTDRIIEQITILHHFGIEIVVVHGGGPQATEIATKLGVESEFIDGRRVTSAPMVESLVMALNGTTNTAILSSARRNQLPAIGISGIDCGILRAVKKAPVQTKTGLVEYGMVGQLQAVVVQPINDLLAAGRVPVLSPLAADDDGTILNVNADVVASALAVALSAVKLIIITTPQGILRAIEDPQSLISEINATELANLKDSDVFSSGMLPKADSILSALSGGVRRVHVISYAFPDSLLTEIFTNEGCGTMVTQDPD